MSTAKPAGQKEVNEVPLSETLQQAADKFLYAAHRSHKDDVGTLALVIVFRSSDSGVDVNVLNEGLGDDYQKQMTDAVLQAINGKPLFYVPVLIEKGPANWTKNVEASDAENHFTMVAEGIGAADAIGLVVAKFGELLDYNPELVADIEKSLKADLILPILNLGDRVAICVGIDDADREAYAEIGPRDWQWDTDTGELLGCGTTLGDQQQA